MKTMKKKKQTKMETESPETESEISETEESIIDSVPLQADEVEDTIVDADFDDDDDDDDLETDEDGQVEMYQDDARIKNKQSAINEGYKSVENRIRKIGEHAAFFKSLSGYLVKLDPEPDADVIKQNLGTALFHAATLSEDISFAITQLKKIDAINEELMEMTGETAEEREPLPHPSIKFVKDELGEVDDADKQ